MCSIGLGSLVGSSLTPTIVWRTLFDDRVEDVVAGANAQLPQLTVERGTSSSG
jgi:hypothetical protein